MLYADFVTAENATADALGPIVDEVKSVLNGAIAEVNKLVDQPASLILSTVDGTAQVTVQELAQVIGDLLNVRVYTSFVFF